MKCQNPRCESDFAQDDSGRYSFEIIHTGVDYAFVCPVCQHWNRLPESEAVATRIRGGAAPSRSAVALQRLPQSKN